jgi:hypothetical protein
MPKLMSKGLVLAAALGLFAWAGAARADQDPETVRPHPDAHQPHPVLKALHIPVPLGCWASHNGYTCGSLQSEGVFIFGSCRAFYGEPCLKGPPPPPWSPEAYLPQNANGPADGAGPVDGTGRRRGCNCGW